MAYKKRGSLHSLFLVKSGIHIGATRVCVTFEFVSLCGSCVPDLPNQQNQFAVLAETFFSITVVMGTDNL